MLRFAGGLLVIAVLNGCMVGPDYQRPPLTPGAGYARQPRETIAAAGVSTQQLSADRDVPGRWWAEFQSPVIEHLVDQAIAKNPDLASAQAALRSAHALLAAQRGAFYPQVGAGFSASRQSNSVTLASPLNSNSEDYSLYTGQLSIVYAPDVFGGIRRQVEAAQAQDEGQKFATEAAYLTLTSNVVVAAIAVASLRSQIAMADAVIKTDTQILEAAQLRRQMGEGAAADVAAQEAVVAQAQAALPPLRKQLGQQYHILAVLTGQSPAEFSEPGLDMGSLHLPSSLPLSIPSQLVEHRPDIRAAEANLHAASAEVGVAISNRIPSISLDAALGGASTDITTLFAGGNALWSVTGGITQPIFDGGTLREKQHAAEAQFDQAKAQYRSALLVAFQNVADTLLALKEDAQALKAAKQAELAAQSSLSMAQAMLRQERAI